MALTSLFAKLLLLFPNSPFIFPTPFPTSLCIFPNPSENGVGKDKECWKQLFFFILLHSETRGKSK